MNKDNVVQIEGRNLISDGLTQLLQNGARELLAQAIEAEVSDFLVQFQDRKLENGRSAVVRNGHHLERDIQTGIGPVSVKALVGMPTERELRPQPVSLSTALFIDTPSYMSNHA